MSVPLTPAEIEAVCHGGAVIHTPLSMEDIQAVLERLLDLHTDEGEWFDAHPTSDGDDCEANHQSAALTFAYWQAGYEFEIISMDFGAGYRQIGPALLSINRVACEPPIHLPSHS